MAETTRERAVDLLRQNRGTATRGVGWAIVLVAEELAAIRTMIRLRIAAEDNRRAEDSTPGTFEEWWASPKPPVKALRDMGRSRARQAFEAGQAAERARQENP